MNIFGFGEENVRTFLKNNIIENIVSIYKINYDDVRKLDGWKEKSIQNLMEGIETSKQNENWRILKWQKSVYLEKALNKKKLG